MKIAYILTAIDQLGPFIVAKDIIDCLFDQVEQIDIFYFKTPQKPLAFKVEPQRISFWAKMDLSGYDIVHSHGFMADVFTARNVKKRAKWVSTLHQEIYPDYSFSHNKVIAYFLEHFWLACLKRADIVATLTKDMRDYYVPKLKGVPIKHVYNGIPERTNCQAIPDEELKSINILKQKTKLLTVSARLIYRKGIDRIIEMLGSSPEYSLLLIGDGEERENLLQQAERLHVRDRILFLGYKNNPQDYLKLCDVYVMASRSEGFGLCVMDAAAQKLPVICNDLPVFREIFDNEIVRFDLEKKETILNALNVVLSKREEFAKKIHEKYYECYTARVMSNNYLNLYKNDSKLRD